MKRAFTIIAVAVAVFTIIGCGGKKADFDVAALGNDLNTKITYQDSLMEMDLDTAVFKPFGCECYKGCYI